MSVYEVGNNRFDAALRHAAEWERVARALPDAERRACALWPTIQVLFFRGEFARLRRNCEQQIAWTDEHPEWGLRDWGVSALANVVAILAQAEMLDGACDRARGLAERAIDAARRVGDVEGEIWATTALGDLGYLAGEPDFARAALERGARMSEPLGALARASAYSRVGRQLVLDGRAAEAVAALEHALSCCKDGNRAVEPFARHVLAQAWLAAGDPARARAIAEETLTCCLEIGARVVAIEAAVTLSAALRAEIGPSAGQRIEEILATADRLIAETGACNLTAFVLVERASLAELRGMVDEQGVHLRRAHAALMKMGAGGRARAVGTVLDRLATAASSGS
jgi:tetratricopeptide (TPR) repeat protein